MCLPRCFGMFVILTTFICLCVYVFAHNHVTGLCKCNFSLCLFACVMCLFACVCVLKRFVHSIYLCGTVDVWDRLQPSHNFLCTFTSYTLIFLLHRFILIGFPLSYEKSPRTKQHPRSQEVYEMRCVHKPLDIDFLNWCKIMYEVLSIGESQTPMPGEGCAICVNVLQEEALGVFVHKN